MEQLLEVDNLEDALSGSLEIIVKTLNSEAGAIWFLDKKTDRLSPLFHIGPADISNISVENGLGLEGLVTKTGKSVIVEDASTDPRFDGTVFDGGLVTKTMICVPLNNLHEVIGCVQVVNKLDGSLYDAEELRLCERMASLAAITIEEKGLIVDLGETKEVLAVLKDVTKEFPSGDGVLKVLKGINLEIYKNEFVVVLGESGCGKSTMMNIVGGMDFLTGGTLTEDLAKKLKVSTPEGVYVSEVVKGGAADKAGIKSEDVILAIDGTRIASMPELQAKVNSYHPGDRATVRVFRGGNTQDLSVEFTDGTVANGTVGSDGTVSFYGAQLRAARDGVEIVSAGNGALARAGGQDGFIIRFVNDQKVSKPQDVIDIAKRSRRSIFIEGVDASGRPGYFGFGKED